jgi:hypothetical protein
MVREVEEIADDATALDWALGCLAVCLMERIKAMMMFALRTGLAGACALFAAGMALPAALVLAWRAHWEPGVRVATTMLDRHPYLNHRLGALLDSFPDWRLGLGALVIALYLAAGAALLLRKRIAPWLFAGAVALAATAVAINHQDQIFREAFTSGDLLRDYAGLALQAAVAAAMFWAMRPRDDGRVV